jgi:transposase
MSRYELTDFEWPVVEATLADKPRGVACVDNQRVLNGIFSVLHRHARRKARLKPPRHARTRGYPNLAPSQ